MVKTKKVIINGDEEELDFIVRFMCHLGLTTLDGYRNSKGEGIVLLEPLVIKNKKGGLNSSHA